jgi:hypothetical protein
MPIALITPLVAVTTLHGAVDTHEHRARNVGVLLLRPLRAGIGIRFAGVTTLG